MDGKRGSKRGSKKGSKKWTKRLSIQWVLDQLNKSVVQEVKPDGVASINYDKSLGDKHLVWCKGCGNVYDKVYGDVYPNFPKYGKEREDHEEGCKRQFTRRN
jgi:hypothetical protein